MDTSITQFDIWLMTLRLTGDLLRLRLKGDLLRLRLKGDLLRFAPER